MLIGVVVSEILAIS